MLHARAGTVLSFVCLLAALAACGPFAPSVAPPTTAPPAASALTIKLNPDSNSGESGAAVLAEVGGKTTVVVTIVGEPAGATQPMHIHDGSCGPTLGKVVYTLSPVASGVSTTTVDTTIDKLKASKFAINGHRSPAEMSVYVFCGNILQ